MKEREPGDEHTGRRNRGRDDFEDERWTQQRGLGDDRGDERKEDKTELTRERKGRNE